MKNKFITKYLKSQSGMTLIELMVVLAIFFIVAGLTMFDYGKFRSTVSLQNLGDDVALSIRRAQNFAIGVHSSTSSNFSYGYGIHFSTSTPNAADARAGSNKTFMIYTDINPNKFYDYPANNASTICNNSTITSTNECFDMISITSNDTVYKICPDGVVANCTTTGYADITFNRPNPDANICTGTISGGVESACSLVSKSVDIVIRNTQTGDTKTVTVSNVGQISIK